MRNLRLSALILTTLLALAACSSPTTTYTGPYGRWAGSAYVNGYYAGAIAAHYDTRSWAWCTPDFRCIVGHTEGWDLVDAYGERATGTYTGSTVRIRYSYLGDTLTATLRPSTDSSSLDALDAASTRHDVHGLREAVTGR